MKRCFSICATILACAALAWAGIGWARTVVVAGGVPVSPPGGCSGCTSSTDGTLHDSSITPTGQFIHAHWEAFSFTVSSTECISGCAVYASDDGNNIGLTCEIYTDSGSNPGSIVGAGFTGSIGNISNSDADNEILFASSQELAPGTYWVITKPTGEYILPSLSTGATNYRCSGDNGSTWDATGDGCPRFEIKVLGCTP